MAIEKYTSYKKSGITWLGDIPDHWEIRRIKYLFKEVDGRSTSGDENLLSVSQYTGVTKKSDKVAEGENLTNAKTLEGYKIVKKGDLVINIMLAWNGSLGISNYNGIVSPAYCVYKNILGNEKYFGYLFKTKNAQQEFKKQSTGIIDSRLRMYTDSFFNIKTAVPPENEQNAIATFLDYKLEKINRFITKKKQLIELLSEQKEAIINKAVIKGINPNAKPKPSGIEWLGDIPEHWEFKKLKYLISEKNIRSKTGEEELLSLSKYKGVIPKSKLAERAGNAESLIGYKKVFENDLVFNKMQAINGIMAVSKIEGLCSPDYSVYYTKDEKELSIKYLEYLLIQNGYKTEFKRRSRGVMEGYIRVYTDALFNIKVPLPRINEQHSIIKLIKEQTSKVNNTILNIEKELTLVEEYKIALIAEAVTGKIDVRDFKVPSTEEPLAMVAE